MLFVSKLATAKDVVKVERLELGAVLVSHRDIVRVDVGKTTGVGMDGQEKF